MIVLSDLSRDLLIWLAAYVVLLLVIGAFGRRAKKTHSFSDHFLAGRALGFPVLILTLFATQYSGNSLSAFPGQTYRQGLVYIMSVTFMVGIVSGYMLFAPTLFARARERGYITPNDFLMDRFNSRPLHYLAASVFCLTLVNYMLAQLMALGHAAAGLTGGDIPYAAAVVGGAAVILVYELMGGMRAVAWTDALQGIVLAVGLAVVVAMLVAQVGTPPEIIKQLSILAPEKVASPDLRTCMVWISTFVLLALGGPLYPQAIQRIFAAKSLSSLKRALAVMAVLPLGAVTAVIFIGAVGIILEPGLDRLGSDRITFLVLGDLVARNPQAYIPALVVMLAVIAAIMSTADSCLLSLSSIITKDFGGAFQSGEPELRLKWAPWISLTVMVVLCLIALSPVTTLWGLLVLKFEILIQLSPAFVLGTLHTSNEPEAYSAADILRGLIFGLSLVLLLALGGHRNIFGIHSGSIAVAANYAIAYGSRAWRLRTSSAHHTTA